MALNVVTLNTLAPCFAQPSWHYPSNLAFLDDEFRRDRILSFLESVKEHDVIALQEVTDDFSENVNGIVYTRKGNYNIFAEKMSKTHYTFFVSHERQHNASYFSTNPLSPYAWIRNGNVLFLKRNTFSNVLFDDQKLGKGGSHAAIATGIHRASGRRMRIMSVHLDTDIGGNRLHEWESIKTLLPDNPSITDLILGDFNTNTQTGILKNDFATFNAEGEVSKFKNALVKVSKDTGMNIYEQTHPWTTMAHERRSSEKSSHIVYRYGLEPSNIYYSGLSKHGTIEGTLTGVIDSNLWILAPDTRPPGYDQNEEIRVNSNLSVFGTDHFPVVARLNII